MSAYTKDKECCGSGEYCSPQNCPCEQRIRALEADNARLKASLEDAEKEERKSDEHREKAEAEVERLKKAIYDHSCYCAICGPNSAHFAIDILPKGGGRESGDVAGGVSAEPPLGSEGSADGSRSAAANREEAIPPAKSAASNHGKDSEDREEFERVAQQIEKEDAAKSAASLDARRLQSAENDLRREIEAHQADIKRWKEFACSTCYRLAEDLVPAPAPAPAKGKEE